eukprot:TRINITY_DN8856_c0_g3_i1.p1 TRINITY_DN8856_c0_g3~~TRINITY_DN8856_c0_g3_i1.p1  ORF type:complete len:264 (+),score=77.55 TRINITY_DN8856_c0_g3_i1:54-794(+)
MESAANILATLLKTVSLIGLVLVAFGPSYSFVLLDILYGAAWSLTSAPRTLAWYCVYVLVMAVNGITESFVFAVIPASQLHSYNAWLLVFSCLYIVASILFISFGSVGLILANCVNFLARICYSIVFISRFFGQSTSSTSSSSAPSSAASSLAQHIVRVTLPSPALLLSLLASALLTQYSAYWFDIGAASLTNSVMRVDRMMVLRQFGSHICVGVGALVITALVFWQTEKDFVRNLNRILRGRKSD